MELELGIEVSEVNFNEFDRRKAPRVSISVDEIQSKDYFANIADELEQLRFEVGK